MSGFKLFVVKHSLIGFLLNRIKDPISSTLLFSITGIQGKSTSINLNLRFGTSGSVRLTHGTQNTFAREVFDSLCDVGIDVQMILQCHLDT